MVLHTSRALLTFFLLFLGGIPETVRAKVRSQEKDLGQWKGEPLLCEHEHVHRFVGLHRLPVEYRYEDYSRKKCSKHGLACLAREVVVPGCV